MTLFDALAGSRATMATARTERAQEAAALHAGVVESRIAAGATQARHRRDIGATWARHGQHMDRIQQRIRNVLAG